MSTAAGHAVPWVGPLLDRHAKWLDGDAIIGGSTLVLLQGCGCKNKGSPPKKSYCVYLCESTGEYNLFLNNDASIAIRTFAIPYGIP